MENNENDKILDLFTGQPMTEEDLEFTKELEGCDVFDTYEGHGTVLNEEKWGVYQQLAESFNNLLGKDKAILKVRHSECPYPMSDFDCITVTFPVISSPEAETRKVIADAINACDMFCISSGNDKKVRMTFSVLNIWKDFGYKERPKMNIDPKSFKDIQELHLAIWELVMESSAFDETEFDCDAVALYLTWFGLTDDQIAAYRKADVLGDGIMINGAKRTLPYDILNIFLRLRDSKGYFANGGEDGVVFHAYEESDCLIRNAEK